MSSSAILVTGGAGYVGAHACKALRRAGYTPVVFDNLSTGHKSFVRWGPFVPGDIRDTDAVRHTIGAYQIEAVLHFAASAYVGESVADPQKYYENNVGGSLSLLRAMLEAGCRTLVFSSTCAIYGEPAEIPIGETTPQNPVNPYGASKAMVERILRDYQRAHEISAIALRYFNASGADPEVRGRRAARSGNPSHPKGDDGNPGSYPGFCGVRDRLSHPRRHRDQRLYSRLGPCRGTRRGGADICLLAKPAAPSILAPVVATR